MSLDTSFLSQALEMSNDDRAELARRLLLSLEEDAFDADAQEAWAAEIEVRLNRYSGAQESASDWRSAIDRIRRSLKPGPKQ